MRAQDSSKSLFEEMKSIIPEGVNSPVRAFPGLDQTPLILDKGKGDMIYDVDGNEYIDFCCSWGALILGHANPRVINPVKARLDKGTSFGTSTKLEMDIAKEALSHLPAMEKIRFVSSGTEATMTATRIARGYTGRDLIIKFNGCYHGHSDAFLVQAGSGMFGKNSSSSSAGVPDGVVANTVSLPYNDSEAFLDFMSEEKNRSRLACVILEPIAANMGLIPAEKEWIELLRKETSKCGAILIFDEVVTGFRVGLGGAQGYYDIYPDLTCLGKIIGGGFPAAAVAGKAEIMDVLAPKGDVYQAGTLSGNPIAMEAGFQALIALNEEGFYEELERKAKLFIEPISEWIQKNKAPACIQSIGSMFTLFFGRTSVADMDEGKQLDTKMFQDFFKEMLDQGIYFSPSPYEMSCVSSVHSDLHIEKAAYAVIAFLEKAYAQAKIEEVALV